MINIDKLKYVDIVPQNLKSSAHSISVSKAIESEYTKMIAYAENVIIYPRIRLLGDELLDLLAKQFDVAGYDNSFSVEVKRELVATSLTTAMTCGTVGAVENKVATVFGDAMVEEWFDFGGDPYTFKVSTNNAMATAEMQAECIRIVQSTKNARSQLVEIVVNAGGVGSMFVGAIMQTVDIESMILNFERR